jgi:hypothetical protein
MRMQVWIGGNLPESALPDLIEILEDSVADDSLNLIDGWGIEQDTIENLIRGHKDPNTIELEFKIEKGMDGEVHTCVDLDNFCQSHGLSIKKLLPPYAGDEGHCNECYYVRLPGDDGPRCIPTDGLGNVEVKQSDVIELFDKCWALHQRPLEDMGLLINDKDSVVSLYAKATLAHRPFEIIFKELLTTWVGNEIPDLPDFKIVAG